MVMSFDIVDRHTLPEDMIFKYAKTYVDFDDPPYHYQIHLASIGHHRNNKTYTFQVYEVRNEKS